MVKRVIVASAVVATGAAGFACTKPADLDLSLYTLTDEQKTQLQNGAAHDDAIYTDLVATPPKCDEDSVEGSAADATFAVCTEDGDYALSGCTKKECTAPAEAANYLKKADDSALAGPYGAHDGIFDAEVKCATADWELNAGATIAKCGAAGPYTLAGCKDPATITCTAPAGITAFELVAGGAFEDKKKNEMYTAADVKCAATHPGTAVVTKCDDDGEYTLTGCEELTCKKIESHAGYLTVDAADENTSVDVTAAALMTTDVKFNAKVKCDTGYHQTDATIAPSFGRCSVADGEVTFGGCEKTLTCAANAAGAGYKVKGDDTIKLAEALTTDSAAFGATAEIECADTHALVDENTPATLGKCTEEGGAVALTGCEEKMCAAPSSLEGYKAETTDLATLSAKVSFAHAVFGETITCANGYQLKAGETAAIAKCAKHNEAFTLSGCEKKPVECTTPSVEGYEAKDAADKAVTLPAADAKTLSNATLFTDATIKISCAAGFEKAADKEIKITACTEADKPFVLDGCVKKAGAALTCTKPDNVAYYKGVEAQDYQSTDAIFNKTDLECAADAKKDGDAVKITACTEDNKPYVLEGCVKKNIRPSESDAAGPAASAVVRVAVLMLSAFTYLKM